MSNADIFLSHYGVKGMKWGVRKERPTSVPTKRIGSKLEPNADGSIDIPKGALIQRVVNGKRLLSKAGVDIGDNHTYASFTDRDNLRYESNFGIHKNLLVKEASRVLSLRVKEPLKAPTPGETSRIFYDGLKKNPEALKAAQVYLKKAPLGDPKSLERALKNPSSKEAYGLFGLLFDSANYDTKLSPINSGFVSNLKSKGFNTILDPSDSVWGGTYDAPIVIFGGKKNIEVAAEREVTKYSGREVASILKERDKIESGKSLMQRLGYDED